MAKYSTGRGGGGGGDSCELCGSETGDLRRATVAGADLLVCADCAPHGDGDGGRGGRERGRDRGDDRGGTGTGTDESERDRRRRAARNTARVYDSGRGDGSRWAEEGTDYEEDALPYLVSGYGERAEAARQDAGLTAAELAAELEIDEDDLLAVEQGRATRAGVGGSVVRRLEERLDVGLIEET
jgi:ribosome-binding protein aMBF1 (putative translation factor)